MIEPVFVCVGGGKGGVGKSTVAANLGSSLSIKGFRVGFLDMVKKYLSLSLYYIGYISFASEFRASVRGRGPSPLESPLIETCYNSIALNLIALTKRP